MQSDLYKVPAAPTRKRTRDAFRTLPVEIQAMCWSYLPFSDVCRLALVCTYWRDASARYPRLWNIMRLERVPSDPQLLFARSGNLKIRLSVHVRTCADYMRLPQCLRVFAPRLYHLHVVIQLSTAELGPGADAVEENLFGYPVPMLDNFDLDVRSGAGYENSFRLREDVFNEFAPNLRTVSLEGVTLPDRCTAFTTVQAAWVGSILRNREALFAVFPGVELLGVSMLDDWSDLFPPVPPGSQLKKFTVLDDDLDDTVVHAALSHMMNVGYFDIPSITLQCMSGGLLEFAMARPALFRNQTLAINGAGRADLRSASESGDDKRTVIVSAEEVDFWNLRLFLETDNYASQIQHLSIPLYFPEDTPLVSGVVEFPRLLTLIVSCGSPSAEHGSLFDFNCGGFGIIYAPLLTRLEIQRESGYAGEIQPIDPAYVEDFIDMCLFVTERPAALGRPVQREDSDDTDSEDSGSSFSAGSDSSKVDYSKTLELCIDTANGVQFLAKTTLPRYLLSRNCLGNLIIRHDEEALDVSSLDGQRLGQM